MNKKQSTTLYYTLIFAFLILINLFFTSLPLLNILSYESSAVNAIIFTLISGLYWLRNVNNNDERKLLQKIFSAAKFFISVLFIPFVILSISTILCQNCPFSDGIWFYLVISLPSLFVGAAIAEVSITISNKYKYVVFFILFLIVLFSFLPELYFNPQIYFYNPIFAYYPGVIYDENIKITQNLVFYRSINIVFSLIVITLIRLAKIRSKISQLIVITIVTAIYLSFYFLKPALDLSTNINRIESELKGKIETKHFIIYYPNQINENAEKLLLLNHLYYFNKNEKLLNTKLNEKITSIIFESGAQKKELFGAENADVTKPWMNQFYIDYDNYVNSLNHEMLHVFSKNFGKGFFNLPSNYNPGLVEGFATALDNNYNNYDIDYLAYLAYKKNIKISLQNLFNNFSFFSNVSSISYIYAGSFVKFLIQEYSVEKVEQFYSNPDFKLIFDTNVKELEKRYYNYLDSLKFQYNKDKANFYFGGVPLIKKYCARATAKELSSAWEMYNKFDYEKAEKLFTKIFEYSNSYSALNGIVQCKIKSEKFGEAVDLLQKEEKNYTGSSAFYNIEYMLAYLFARERKIRNAIENYDSLIVQNPYLTYYNAASVYKSIAEKDSNEFYNFIENRDSRYKIVKKYLNENGDAFLQYYINTYLIKNEIDSTIDKNYENEMNEIKKLISNHNYNSETYFEISKFSLNNLKFDDAIMYSEIALAKSGKERREVISDFHNKAIWMKNNFNKTEKHEL